MGISLQETSNRMRRNELQLSQGSFSIGAMKIFFTERAVKHWNILSREPVESPYLEVFKNHVDMAHEDMSTTWTDYILLNMVVLGWT